MHNSYFCVTGKNQVCIDFPQITKKKTEDIIHWLEPINET